jgi:GGDEF domain-containing protein
VIAARISDAIAAADLPVTVSIGLTPLQGSTRATVLAANVALHEAKASGRNGVWETAGAPVPTAATKAVT